MVHTVPAPYPTNLLGKALKVNFLKIWSTCRIEFWCRIWIRTRNKSFRNPQLCFFIGEELFKFRHAVQQDMIIILSVVIWAVLPTSTVFYTNNRNRVRWVSRRLGSALHQFFGFVWNLSSKLKARPIEWYCFHPTSFLIGQYLKHAYILTHFLSGLLL